MFIFFVLNKLKQFESQLAQGQIFNYSNSFRVEGVSINVNITGQTATSLPEGVVPKKEGLTESFLTLLESALSGSVNETVFYDFGTSAQPNYAEVVFQVKVG